MTILSISKLRSGYGKIEVLHDVDVTIERGQIVTLIGANGAGKNDATENHIRADPSDCGHDRIRRTEHRPPATAQDRRARPQSGAGRPGHPQAHDCARQPAHGGVHPQRSEIGRDIDAVFQRFPALAERRPTNRGDTERRRAADAGDRPRADGTARLLLLDEPSLGLAPKFITRIFLTLREFKKEGKTILLVEQNARQALQVADRGYVMERGRIVLSGSGQELAEHARGPAHLSRAACGMTTPHDGGAIVRHSG